MFKLRYYLSPTKVQFVYCKYVLQVPTLFVNDSWAYLNIICYSELDLVTQSNYCHQSYAKPYYNITSETVGIELYSIEKKVYNNFPKMFVSF